MNNISDKGAKALASLTSLTRLNLLSNNISVEGAKALANGKLKNLKQLNLENNNMVMKVQKL
ncbi:hypothetical protein [Wolbachia endosymbiont (group A) of Portevinia maculata]|uniref:hypothetical protein n=1 Tax=Wolbachia endosymbiont (group A) of Portevinia maculata TaxID=3066155 RepID=UPI00333E409A